MVTCVFALSPLGMVCSGQVWQEPGKAHVLPRRIGRQSEFAPNPLPGCPLLAPSAQGEELPMHQFSSLEVEAKDDACGRKMARYTIWQKSGARRPARFKQFSNIIRALLQEHGLALGEEAVQYRFKRDVLAAWCARA